MSLRVVVPAALMVAVAAVQIPLALRGGLTPWKGGGFGMFSTLDHGAFRGIEVIVSGSGGSETIEIPPSLETLAARAVTYPSDSMLRRLAGAVAARERRYQRSVTQVKLTVWRTDFRSRTLLATERTLRTLTVDIP